jgi:transposase/transposase IS116/IS110/IS902 family protein
LSTRQDRIWVGIDAGKGHHWAVALGTEGETLFSTKVINDEAQILTLIETARERPDEVRWAVDISGRAPVARDSGRRTSNYHRPKRYHRRLRHIFYMAAQTAMMRPGPSRDYYLKKRAEGLLHTQALLSLARRRVDVLWAMLRDKRLFTPAPPVTQAA